jgi:LPS sulfotransferase NodH
MTPTRFYVICTTPRSGSNFLCRELARRGAFGKPREFFNFHRPMFQFARELAAKGMDDYIAKLFAAYTSPEAVFGWKAFWFDFLFLRDMVGRFERFQPLTYIYLHRRDDIAQAVSFAYARASGAWHSEDLMQVDLPYDRAGIDDALRAVRWNRGGWEDFFATGAVTPLRVEYDDLVRDPVPAIQQIALALGLPAELAPPSLDLPALEPQREWGKQQWLIRYRQETGQPGDSPVAINQ